VYVAAGAVVVFERMGHLKIENLGNANFCHSINVESIL
jgi:hypothetical protein